MVNITKGSAIFKHSPEDFIVEEFFDNYLCKVSSSINDLDNAKVNLKSLNTSDRRDFLMCELEKFNLDHFTALLILSKQLGNQPHELGFAGTKDKVAWTCQRISIFNANIDKIKDFHFPGVLLKNFKWINHKIKIGDLTGNRFRIVLRDADSDAIKILNRVRNTEFIPNFFGMQRFGSLRGDNVKIGKLIFQSKFKEAVIAILTGFGENESDEVIRAKIRFKSDKNIESAKINFPISLKTEHSILNHLSNFPEDWVGALKTLDEKVLLLMCQSVQSHIFNEILEMSIQQNLELHNSSINLIGFDCTFSPGNLGFIEQEVLKNNSLTIENFKVQEIPFLSLKTSKRSAYFKVHDVEVHAEDDELFLPSKKIMLSFRLDSGCYATTLLENFFILR